MWKIAFPRDAQGFTDVRIGMARRMQMRMLPEAFQIENMTVRR